MLLGAIVASAQSYGDSIKVSMVICTPGAEVYELEGHAALRVTLPNGADMAVNYGIFDFASPNFVYRFVKGETDYMCAAYPFTLFLDSYTRHGRRVVEYPLRLTADEKERLVELLQENLLPENRVYRYNYVKDNCSTRPMSMVERAVGDTLTLKADPTTDGWTFRKAMAHYHTNYPWYQFGIDLALGSGIDYPVSDREKAFAPDQLMAMLPTATIGGRKIADEPIEYQGIGEGGPASPTPWPLTPMAVALYVLAIVVVTAIIDLRRRKVTRTVDALYMTLAGVAGCIIAFLVFVSTHEATTPNYLLAWLNPLCFIVPACIFIKKCSKLLLWYEFVNFALIFLLCIAWPLTGQSANAAFWPLIAADLILSARYIYLKTQCAKRPTTA